MKRKLAYLAALFALLLGLASCGGLQSLSSISAMDYLAPDAGRFSAPLHVKRADIGGEFTNFTYDATLEKLREILQGKCPDTRISTAQDRFIVIEQPENIFLIEQINRVEGDRYNRFVCFAPIASIEDGGDSSYGQLVYMPYHLLNGLEAQYYGSQPLQVAQFSRFERTAQSGIDDFEAFYRKWSAVDVARPDGSTLVVTCDADSACARLTLTFEGDAVHFSAELREIL